jgi:uncharacterized membrane protein
VSTNDPLDGPVDALKLHALAGAGLLDARALAWALARIGRRPTAETWYRFARVQLLILGASLVAVGAVFFVAANWDGLSPHARMGLLAALMAGATLSAGWLGLSTLSGRAAALLGGLGFGPLMALYGQTYQTGADAWELFAAWTLVLAAYALVIRFSGAWITALLLAHVAAVLWFDQAWGVDWEDGGVLALTAIAAADWGLGVALRRRGRAWPVAVLALTLAELLALGLGSVALVAKFDHGAHAVALLWALVQAGLSIALFARRDPHLLRGAAMVLGGLLIVLEGRVIFDDLDMREAGLLLMGLLILAQGWLFGRWLLRVGREDG